jgi:hypothetical protein
MPDGWVIERTLFVAQERKDRRARNVRALVQSSGGWSITIPVLDEALDRCR